MLDIKKLDVFLREKFETGKYRAVKLAGDASDRNFYRLIFSKPVVRGADRAVLMVLGEPWTQGELPYLNVRRFMERAGLPVPALYFENCAAGLILIEDFGDVTLEDAIRTAPADKVEWLYRQAIDLMLRLQIEATLERDDKCVAFSLAFDVEKLMYELNFFFEHAILNYKQAKVADNDELEIRRGFRHISETIAAEPGYLNHRDYHSRNIMVDGGKLKLVDFQDARLGPIQYDLASLLMDSYVRIPDDMIGRLQEYCKLRLSEKYKIDVDGDHFDKIFDYMVVQRNIKAAGSFAYLDCVKIKNRYLKYFAPCLSRVKPAAMRHDELRPFIETLVKYVDELR
jgi:N-acetylmuramate 1-kinase